MKNNLFLVLLSLFFTFKAFCQPLRVAILDFDNISGIAKYDGLGKAMSSMLISDIESNVSQKRLQLVERAQINKIMKEQNLQKSASFDKNTSVKIGKLLGVNFLLIGDIYILDNSLVINARLTDASSGEIKFSEKQEGKINEWLTVKTKLGKGVVTSMSMPFMEPRIPDVTLPPAVLTTYASAIEENDKGNFEKAEILISTAKVYNPEFGYLDDLEKEIERLKADIAQLKVFVNDAIENPIELAMNFLENNETENAEIYLNMEKKRLKKSDLSYQNKEIFIRYLESQILQKKGDFSQAKIVQEEILKSYPFFLMCRKDYLSNLIKCKVDSSTISQQFLFFLNNYSFIQSKQIADTSVFRHNYVSLGIFNGGAYVLSLGYGNYEDDVMSYEYQLMLYGIAGESYYYMKDFNKGNYYYDKAFKFLEELREGYKKSGDWYLYKNLLQETGFLTQFSWTCAVSKKYDYAISMYKKVGIDEISYDLMSVINFGHIFYALNEKQKAIELYCWAFQNNHGKLPDIKNIINNDLEDLEIKGVINLECKNKIILTNYDREKQDKIDFINTKAKFNYASSVIEFLGNSRVCVTVDGVIYQGKVEISVIGGIELNFNSKFYFKHLTHSENNLYRFKVLDNGEKLVFLGDDNIQFLKNK
jgi:TolB-like protein/tetratricopeptide (TPR) repeat protein